MSGERCEYSRKGCKIDLLSSEQQAIQERIDRFGQRIADAEGDERDKLIEECGPRMARLSGKKRGLEKKKPFPCGPQCPHWKG